jgi:hypothetical protein
VVTALAEDGPGAKRRRRDAAEAAGAAIPAMATLPKVEPIPLDGPALGGPSLAQTQPPQAPPYLEVIGARQLPTETAEEPAPHRKTRVMWGLGALIAVIFAAAYAFRRRWSAGASCTAPSGQRAAP